MLEFLNYPDHCYRFLRYDFHGQSPDQASIETARGMRIAKPSNLSSKTYSAANSLVRSVNPIASIISPFG